VHQTFNRPLLVMWGDGCQGRRYLHLSIHTIMLLGATHQGVVELIASLLTLVTTTLARLTTDWWGHDTNVMKSDKLITASGLGWFSLTQTINSSCCGVISQVIYVHHFSCVLGLNCYESSDLCKSPCEYAESYHNNGKMNIARKLLRNGASHNLRKH